MLGNRTAIFIEKEQGAQIEALIQDVMQKYENPPVDEKSLSTDCYRLLMYFVDGVYTRDLMQDPLYEKYVAPVVKEIETNYGQELTVLDLSRRVYITPQYLSRLFGRFLGCSAYEYLTVYRINKAKELLLTFPRMSVQDISQRAGFTNASHFTASFKKNNRAYAAGISEAECAGKDPVRKQADASLPGRGFASIKMINSHRICDENIPFPHACHICTAGYFQISFCSRSAG